MGVSLAHGQDNPTTCNEIADQYISALSKQINFLSGWDMAALGALLATAFGIVLHNHANPDKCIKILYCPLWTSVFLLGVSLFLSYLATNGLTQAIPEICAHNFGQQETSLRESSRLYDLSVWMMQAQYLAFLLAILFAIVLIVKNRGVLRT